MNAKMKVLSAILVASVITLIGTTRPAAGGAPVDLNDKLFDYVTKSKAKVSGVGKATGILIGAILFQNDQWVSVEIDDDGNEYWYAGPTRASRSASSR